MIYKILKRILDSLIASIGIIILLPIFVTVSVLLLLSDEHQIFYRQERIGKHGKKFGILKFATMLKDSPTLGNGMLTVRNDPRITKVGKWLRLTKLNELPQLWNVFVGQMSFVGPRPLTSIGITRYDPAVSQTILTLRPGITGIGSLVFRDEEKLVSLCKENGGDPKAFYREHIFPFKGKVECWYASKQSFFIDFLLLTATLYSVVFNDRKIAFKLFKDLPELPKELTLTYFKSEIKEL
jgi:lipopolysaccharide/colanic/teichoic acid biosynthesis glycosyltransferase